MLAFKVSSDGGTTFYDLRDKANALITVTVDLAASHAYPLPTELAGAEYFQIWTQAASVNVNQTGDKTFTLFLKST